jgi:3-phenylpropionate/trans-cinnamate dioxygenase ferredoxin component
METTLRQVAALDDIEDDEPLGLEVDGMHVALYKLDGAVFATENVCPHQFALLSDGYMEDGCIECPLHQARFDIRTGAAQCGPVDRPLRVFPVHVDGDAVFIDLGRS